MRKQHLLFVLLCLGTVFFVKLALAAPFECSFKTSCTGDEVVVLYAENDSGGYYNAHVGLNNVSTTYNYSLCCESDASHILNASCSNASTTTILRINGTNNTHAQIPAINTYDYDICLGATYGDLSCQYVNGSCTGGNSPLLSMASSGATNATNAHIANYSFYTLNVCCQLGASPPDTPTLLYPANGNETVFERMVNLNWTTYEPDGDSVTFNVSLNVSSGSCAVEHSLETGVTDSNFTTSALCVDQHYNWSVQACDVDGCSAWASIWNFTIQSTLGVRFLQNATSFPTLSVGETNSTDSGPASPMSIENNGNIVENIELNATGPLFQNASLDSSAFQVRAAQNEPGSYAAAQTTYINVPSAMTELFTNLSYVDTNDDGLIHFNVTVPLNEPAGDKSTTITVRAVAVS